MGQSGKKLLKELIALYGVESDVMSDVRYFYHLYLIWETHSHSFSTLSVHPVVFAPVHQDYRNYRFFCEKGLQWDNRQHSGKKVTVE